jgi:hypothetical protein
MVLRPGPRGVLPGRVVAGTVWYGWSRPTDRQAGPAEAGHSFLEFRGAATEGPHATSGRASVTPAMEVAYPPGKVAHGDEAGEYGIMG